MYFDNGMGKRDERDTSGRSGRMLGIADSHTKDSAELSLGKQVLGCWICDQNSRIASNSGNSNPRRYRKNQQNSLKMDT